MEVMSGADTGTLSPKWKLISLFRQRRKLPLVFHGQLSVKVAMKASAGLSSFRRMYCTDHEAVSVGEYVRGRRGIFGLWARLFKVLFFLLLPTLICLEARELRGHVCKQLGNGRLLLSDIACVWKYSFRVTPMSFLLARSYYMW